MGQTVQLPTANIQPIAAEDVANELMLTVLDSSLNGTREIAGPERFRFSEIIEKYLKATNDSRKVISDTDAKYFGAKLTDNTLVPQKKSQLGSINFKTWFESQKKK